MANENRGAYGLRAALLTFVLICFGGTSLAQTSPFYDDPLSLSQAFGLELIASKLHGIDALEGDYGDYLEFAEDMAGQDYARFGGSLAALDAGLDTEFRAALQAVLDDVEAGTDATDSLATAWDVHGRVYEALLPAETRTIGFIAMSLSDLLLESDGVAEAYEDAADGDLWAVPSGYGAQVRVEEVWFATLYHNASETQRADMQEMFDFLSEMVYPSVRPPDEIRGNPEEAEGATQRAAGILEAISGDDLFPGRTLGRLANRLNELLAPACEAYAAGQDDIAIEFVYAARNPYRKHLRRLLDLIAPEIHQPALAHLDALTSSPPEDRAGACEELRDLLAQAGSML